MMGGYEYTPENLNARKDDLLRVKHNEASIVLPTLFADADYEATVTDPPFPNYTWKGDLSAFEGKNNIRALELFGKYKNKFEKETGYYNSEYENISIGIKTEIRKFSVLQILIPALRDVFYGNFKIYNRDVGKYLDTISCLYYFSELTDFDAKKNQYIFMGERKK